MTTPKNPFHVSSLVQAATGVTPTPPSPKPAVVVTPPTVPAFSLDALVAAVAALPGATILTVSRDLGNVAHLMVTPGISGQPIVTPPPASIAHLRVRTDHMLSPQTWRVSVG